MMTGDEVGRSGWRLIEGFPAGGNNYDGVRSIWCWFPTSSGIKRLQSYNICRCNPSL